MKTPTAPETTTAYLLKRRADNAHHMTVVVFTVTGDVAELYTWATWTDYEGRHTLTREEARSDYRKLLADGYVPAKRIVDEYGNPETVAA